jgi:poly(3-hydroxybutyrate) depolymerase
MNKPKYEARCTCCNAHAIVKYSLKGLDHGWCVGTGKPLRPHQVYLTKVK